MYNIGYRHISIDISIYRHRICPVLIFLQQLAIQSFFEGNPQLRQPVKAFRLQAALLGIVHLISYPVPVDGGDSYGFPMMLTLHSPCWFSGFHHDFASMILGGFPACPPVCAATLPVPLPLPRGWMESPDGRHGAWRLREGRPWKSNPRKWTTHLRHSETDGHWEYHKTTKMVYICMPVCVCIRIYTYYKLYTHMCIYI